MEFAEPMSPDDAYENYGKIYGKQADMFARQGMGDLCPDQPGKATVELTVSEPETIP